MFQCWFECFGLSWVLLGAAWGDLGPELGSLRATLGFLWQSFVFPGLLELCFDIMFEMILGSCWGLIICPKLR